MANLKYLEFQRLIKELQFVESDYSYQSEIIKQSDKIFLDWMNLKIPDLEIFENIFLNLNKTLSKNINTVIGISGNGNFVKELIKKDEIWENSKSYI